MAYFWYKDGILLHFISEEKEGGGGEKGEKRGKTKKNQVGYLYAAFRVFCVHLCVCEYKMHYFCLLDDFVSIRFDIVRSQDDYEREREELSLHTHSQTYASLTEISLGQGLLGQGTDILLAFPICKTTHPTVITVYIHMAVFSKNKAAYAFFLGLTP